MLSTGFCSTIFSKKEIHIDITPPTVLTGEKIEMSNKVPTVVVPLDLEGLGTICININAEEII